jgi:uncharacterized protein (TIRG00374 family)
LKNARKLLILLLKISASLAIIGGLFYLALNSEENRKTFAEIVRAPKAWGMLAAGFCVLFVAILITFVRWRYLVVALEINLSLVDSVRIGFLGYLFNLAPMGIVGGDVVKALMLAREHPGNRAKSLASVVVDRIVGLYVLFLVAAAGVFITGFWRNPDPRVHWICIAVLVLTAVATVGIALVLIPGFLESGFVRAFTSLPKVGHALDSLLDAMKIYRTKRLVLFWTSVMTVPVHGLLTVSLCLLAFGLRFEQVPFRDYFAIYPISGIASTIPLPAGPAETGIVLFYKTARVAIAGDDGPAVQNRARQEGLILALVYRLTTILVAPIGAAYYFLGARSEVKDVMHEIEESEEPEEAASPN